MRKGRVLLSMVVCVLSLLLSGMASAQQWAKTYGGTNGDDATSIQPTADGGYIVAGQTFSFGVGAWVLKLDSGGTIQWQKTYGVSRGGRATSIQPTADGGYIVAGEITPFFGAGNVAAWVLKLDSGGTVQWQKSYGGTGYGNDWAASIQQTTDGGYIVVGTTTSFGAGGPDAWVLKLDSSGNVTWQKTYGGTGYDSATSIQPTADGGYIVAGTTTSFGAGYGDTWVLKLDSGGTIQWQKTYGGWNLDQASSIQPTADGGYIVAGWTYSFGASGPHAWVLKLDSGGTIQWQKTYGGTGYDSAASIRQTADGGYIVVGTTTSFGAGGPDAWVLKLDSSGNVTWQKTYGGTGYDSATSIQPTADGGYIVAGTTTSFGAGYGDTWVLKLDSSGNITGCAAQGTSTATVTDTSVTGADTTVSGANTAVTVSDTGVPPQNTTAATTTVCSASGTFSIENKPPVCSAATASPASLWAPNHQMVPVSILGVTDPDGNAVTIAATSVFQDEQVKATGTGSGNTSPDATLSPLAVRAERDGNPKTPGNGRVYHINFTADDGYGGTCSGSVTVCVPHDQRPGSTCVDGGPLYDSTIP